VKGRETGIATGVFARACNENGPRAGQTPGGLGEMFGGGGSAGAQLARPKAFYWYT
jgi:hypothetical protein